jgi:hypothetical protein
MKKIVCSFVLVFMFSIFSFADYTEGIDFEISYKQKETGYSNTMHINFFTVRPPAVIAERMVINYLKAYGSRNKNKNILGSAYYSAGGRDGSYSKIKFNNSLGAYVWVSKVGRVMSFPSYMYYLKKVRGQKIQAARTATTNNNI